MSDQIYFTDGNFYQCVTAAVAGESPTTAPTKWRTITLPSKWRWALARLTYAHLLMLDGQTDKASVASAQAYGRERTGLDDLIRAEANEEEGHCGHGERRGPTRIGSGRTLNVKASVVLDDVYRLIGWDAAQLDSRDKSDARASLSLAVQEVWDAWWWQTLMVCERLACGPIFNETSLYSNVTSIYGEATAVLSEPENAYYIVLINLGNYPPRPEDDPTGWRLYDPNNDPVEADVWDVATTYAENDAVSYLGIPYHSKVSGNLANVPSGGGQWTPIPAWSPSFPYTSVEDATATYGPYGPIRGVSKHDPRTTANPEFYQLAVTETTTRIIGLDIGRPWVWSRRVTPILTGDPYDSALTYTAVATSELVYDA